MKQPMINCLFSEGDTGLMQAALRAPMLLILMSVTLLSCGQQKVAKSSLEKLGSFYGCSTSNWLEETFQLPSGFEGHCLGLSVEGSQEQIGDVTCLAANLAQMRLLIQLFQKDESDYFYQAELSLRDNYAYYPLWRPAYGVLIGGLEPFPYAWPETSSNSVAMFRYGKSAGRLENGKLVPNVAYRMRLTVLDPTPVTNRLQLWVYSYSTGRGTSHKR